MPRPVPTHPAGGSTRQRRVLVVRAPTSPEEQGFFNILKEKLEAPTMADLLRHLAAERAIELGLELPEKWRIYYEARE